MKLSLKALVKSFLLLAAIFLIGTLSFNWPKISNWMKVGTFSESNIAEVKYAEGTRSVRIDNGQIVSKDEYELTFPFSGKVEQIFAEEGVVMKDAGMSLLKLETTELEFEAKRYEAEFLKQKKTVEKLQNGTRYEELLISQKEKQSAEGNLKVIKKEVLDAIYDSFTYCDDAIRNQTDQLFNNPESSDPQLSFSLSDAVLEEDIESERESVGNRLDDWREEINDMESGGNIQKYIDEAKSDIGRIREYLDDVAHAVNSLTTAGGLNQDDIDAWQAAVLTARTNVSTSAVALSSAETDFKVASKDVEVETSEYDLKLAGTRKEDIEIALNAAEAAKNQVEIIKERIKKSTLTTPEENLIVKKIYPKKGEFATSSAVAVIVSSLGFEIEADIPEEDIKGIEAGNEVLIRLVTFPNSDVIGKIKKIEPKEVEKEGSFYFRVRAEISEVPAGIELRSGMTGDIITSTKERGKMLMIPQKAIYLSEGKKFVKAVVSGGDILEKAVETGMSDGDSIEIISGLNAGDKLIVSEKK